MSFINSLRYNWVTFLDNSIDNAFIDAVTENVIEKKMVNKYGGDIKIIFTPLHGTGNNPIRRSLNKVGFNNIRVVKEQESPDPNFTTVISPNPKEKFVFDIAIKMRSEERRVGKEC